MSKHKEFNTKEMINYSILVIVAVILAFLANKYIYYNIRVPTTSMAPTINAEDRVIVSKIYNFEKLKRKDIIVFYSKELKLPLVKRLMGLPGDTVDIKEDGTIYINGEKVDEPYVKFKGGRYGTYKVPEGEYFFLGDNRADSNDSRYWKDATIPKEHILGKARIRIYPFSKISLLK